MKPKWMKLFLNEDWEMLTQEKTDDMDFDWDREDADLSSIRAYDEDNSFAKLGDFWPRERRPFPHNLKHAS